MKKVDQPKTTPSTADSLETASEPSASPVGQLPAATLANMTERTRHVQSRRHPIYAAPAGDQSHRAKRTSVRAGVVEGLDELLKDLETPRTSPFS